MSGIPHPRNIQYKRINKDASSSRKTGSAKYNNTSVTIHETVEEDKIQRAGEACALGGCA